MEVDQTGAWYNDEKTREQVAVYLYNNLILLTWRRVRHKYGHSIDNTNNDSNNSKIVTSMSNVKMVAKSKQLARLIVKNLITYTEPSLKRFEISEMLLNYEETVTKNNTHKVSERSDEP